MPIPSLILDRSDPVVRDPLDTEAPKEGLCKTLEIMDDNFDAECKTDEAEELNDEVLVASTPLPRSELKFQLPAEVEGEIIGPSPSSVLAVNDRATERAQSCLSELRGAT
jgi:hypothetical protein